VRLLLSTVACPTGGPHHHHLGASWGVQQQQQADRQLTWAAAALWRLQRASSCAVISTCAFQLATRLCICALLPAAPPHPRSQHRASSCTRCFTCRRWGGDRCTLTCAAAAIPGRHPCSFAPSAAWLPSPVPSLASPAPPSGECGPGRPPDG